MDVAMTMPARFVVLALFAAACSGTAEAPVITTAGPVGSTAPATTVGVKPPAPTGSGETTSTTLRPAPDPNRPIAPDFTLDLGSGGTFVLSEETRPVFMVFWAEW